MSLSRDLKGLQRQDVVLTKGAAFASNGDNTVLAAPGENRQYVIAGYALQNESAVATTMQLKNGGNVFHRFLGQTQGANQVVVFAKGNELKCGNNNAIVLNLSGANSCGLTVWYWSEAFQGQDL